MSARAQVSELVGGWRYRALVVSVALTALGYLALSVWAGWSDLLKAFSAVGVIGVGVALGLSLLNYVLRFVRWQHYLRLLGHSVPWFDSFRMYIAGFALTTTPAKAGEIVRSVFLHRYGVKYSESVAAFFAERLSDLMAILIVTTIGISSHAAALPWVMGLGAIIVAVLLTLQNARWLRCLEELVRQISWPRVREPSISVIEMVLQFRRCFTVSAMTYGTVLAVLAWAAEALAFYLVAGWMGADISLAEAWFIFGFATLVGAISFLPGGLGSTEAVMVSLLLLNGMAGSEAIACTLLVRVTTLWFAVALGLIALPHQEPKCV
jgi:uncharacterized protein (TIRG00374 family)